LSLGALLLLMVGCSGSRLWVAGAPNPYGIDDYTKTPPKGGTLGVEWEGRERTYRMGVSSWFRLDNHGGLPDDWGAVGFRFEMDF